MSQVAESSGRQDGLVFAPREVCAHFRVDQSILLTSPLALAAPVSNLVEYLQHWAEQRPEHIFLGEKSREGGWRTITFAAAWRSVQAVGQSLLDRNLTSDTPIAILSGASIDHAMLTFGAMLVGVPVSPISPNYSLIADALPRLEGILKLLDPAMVFAQDAEALPLARSLALLDQVAWLSAVPGQAGTDFIGDMYDTGVTAAVAEAQAKIDVRKPAKILFTSGSTGAPKGVINTQQMLCTAICAASQLAETAAPPVLLDWLPWHHTMGGNAVLHGALKTGGSLYIDDGRPTPNDFHRTVANIAEIGPTTLLSVPLALQMLAGELERNDAFREAFFASVLRVTYAGASLPQDTWERIQIQARKTLGREIVLGSGFGTTETGPGISITHWPTPGGGEIGLPVPGMTLKLVPQEDTYELRVKGASVTPGYYKSPEITAAAYDEEGFYKVGDLVRFVDPANLHMGLRYAGRLSENFKLSSGTWVATGELRLSLLDVLKPMIADVVIAGHDQEDVRIMLWLAATDRAARAEATAEIARRLTKYNAIKTGGAQRIGAFLVLLDPPSIGLGEITDKGYVNQRGVLKNRSDLVADLYAPASSTDVVLL